MSAVVPWCHRCHTYHAPDFPCFGSEEFNRLMRERLDLPESDLDPAQLALLALLDDVEAGLERPR